MRLRRVISLRTVMCFFQGFATGLLSSVLFPRVAGTRALRQMTGAGGSAASKQWACGLCSTGERLPWGPGRSLYLLQPCVLAGLVVPDGLAERDLLSAMNIDRRDWEAFRAYQQSGVPLLRETYQRLVEGWTVFQRLRNIPLPSEAGNEVEETPAEAGNEEEETPSRRETAPETPAPGYQRVWTKRQSVCPGPGGKGSFPISVIEPADVIILGLAKDLLPLEGVEDPPT